MEKRFYPGWPEKADWVHYDPLNIASVHHPCLPSNEPNSFNFHGVPLPSTSIEGSTEGKATIASKSHRQAEKRRRERINAQLAALRKLIPKSDKMDKAALLGSVVDQVKDLKRKAVEIGKVLTIPTEIDEVTVDSDSNLDATSIKRNKDGFFIKASVCCEDRPELLSDIIQALKGLRLKMVRADMATLGGRVISILILCTEENEGGACLSSLKQSLHVVLSRVVSLSSSLATCHSSKRQRILFPSSYDSQ